ncbi:uncharacterized protein K452DRAFT_203225, partial [Aplosporella prunicola CBS 121167]
YEALSYTWHIDRDYEAPTPGRMRTIICNGKTLKVHQNLYNALLQLRQHNRGHPFWIDAICIDQGDGGCNSEKRRAKIKSEKSAQVNIMGTIFGSAQAVVVWLGRSSALTYMATKLIQPLFNNKKKE